MFRHGWKLIGLIFVGLLVFFWLIKAPIMAAYLSDKLGLHVTVKRISMWPTVTTMRHFMIANPHGFNSVAALDVEKTTINYRLRALINHPSEIDQITLENVFLHIELLGSGKGDNNWAAIGARMPKKRDGNGVIVHKLVLKNMTVLTEGPGAKALGVAGTQHFDYMEFDHIDSRDGFPTKEAISKIFQNAGLLKYLENFLNPTQKIKDALNPFNIFGKKDQASEIEISKAQMD